MRKRNRGRHGQDNEGDEFGWTKASEQQRTLVDLLLYGKQSKENVWTKQNRNAHGKPANHSPLDDECNNDDSANQAYRGQAPALRLAISEKGAPKDQNKTNGDQQCRNPGREEPRVDPGPGVKRIARDIGNRQCRDRDQYGAQCNV
jgi:hypothetical protein